MANDDMTILRAAYERESDPRDRRPPHLRSWEYWTVGATKRDANRLCDEGFIEVAMTTGRYTRYHLTEKGRGFVAATQMEHEQKVIPATDILDAMSLIVGFQDIKETIARAIEARRRTHFLLSGPPACAKSLVLEAVRSTVPDAYIAFGSRTSAAGLSDALFENQPSILLLDELDKIDSEVYSILLGLMESGEVLETKSRRTRGIRLETMLIGACNKYEKMPPEFLSRFALHIAFPRYSREEFIDVCKGFLTRAESCPVELAAVIGQLVFDHEIGDVRKARSCWQLMTSPTVEEVKRVVELMLKYAPDPAAKDTRSKKKVVDAIRMPGI